jgi:hypothetical protein
MVPVSQTRYVQDERTGESVPGFAGGLSGTSRGVLPVRMEMLRAPVQLRFERLLVVSGGLAVHVRFRPRASWAHWRPVLVGVGLVVVLAAVLGGSMLARATLLVS